MKLTYINSATVVIEHAGVRVLCDPWLEDGAFLGSWFHVPALEPDWDLLRSCEFIYISHIHPDHASIDSLKRLNKDSIILIAPYAEKFLGTMLRGRGYEVRELQPRERFPLGPDFWLEIMAADACNPQLCGQWIGCQLPGATPGLSYQIDSLAWFQGGKRSILNTNDCPFGLAEKGLTDLMARNGKPDLLLVGYSGASSYPQCWEMDEATKREKAGQKYRNTLLMCERYIDVCRPQWFLPFAGQYTLGGKLFGLNAYRGMPDLEHLNLWLPPNMVRLNRDGWFDLDSGQQDAPFRRVNPAIRMARERVIANAVFPYEEDEEPTGLELRNLILAATDALGARTRQRGLVSDWAVRIRSGELRALVGLSGVADGFGKVIEIHLDPRLLKRLLTRRAHWNQAEIGSHLTFSRTPDVYERAPYLALSYLHV